LVALACLLEASPVDDDDDGDDLYTDDITTSSLSIDNMFKEGGGEGQARAEKLVRRRRGWGRKYNNMYKMLLLKAERRKLAREDMYRVLGS